MRHSEFQRRILGKCDKFKQMEVLVGSTLTAYLEPQAMMSSGLPGLRNSFVTTLCLRYIMVL